MNQEDKEAPFYPKTLEEERDRKVISISLNPNEQALLEEIKEDLNIATDGRAIKTAAFIGKNVLQGFFTRKFLKYLFSNERQKLEDFKKF